MVVNDRELINKLNNRDKKTTVYINPMGTFIRFWRILNSSLLIYNATATPFRVAFHTTKTSSMLYVFELFTDSIFLMDILVSFLTPY